MCLCVCICVSVCAGVDESGSDGRVAFPRISASVRTVHFSSRQKAAHYQLVRLWGGLTAVKGQRKEREKQVMEKEKTSRGERGKSWFGTVRVPRLCLSRVCVCVPPVCACCSGMPFTPSTPPKSSEPTAWTAALTTPCCTTSCCRKWCVALRRLLVCCRGTCRCVLRPVLHLPAHAFTPGHRQAERRPGHHHGLPRPQKCHRSPVWPHVP